MKKDAIALVALDLDGTLTQHRSKLEEPNTRVLDALSKRYELLIVGAGTCRRIHGQMNGYPIDIIGNYGLQVSAYDREKGVLEIVESHISPPDKPEVERRIARLREMSGYLEYAGDTVEFHESGMITFPLIGTKARIEDKLRFDPSREKRRKIYPAVKAAFPEYTVFVGGSSSFDMAPQPYDKLYALDRYCAKRGLQHENVVYFGDDFEPGGNDQQVYDSDIAFIRVDDYRRFAEFAQAIL